MTEFDPKDLEAECFGGEEITHGTTAVQHVQLSGFSCLIIEQMRR